MDLTIVIPAFNEENRLPKTLQKLLTYLPAHLTGTFEILVVDDGSTDRTRDIVRATAETHPQLRLLTMERNSGRGAAVQRGVENASGKIILEMDSDGSVDAEAVPRFVTYMNEHRDIDMLIGSRNIEGSKILVPQPLVRTLLGYVFFTLAWIMFGWDFRDRVNGFKMFRTQAARDIFKQQRETGFHAEAEVVVIAENRGWRYELLPVLWTDDPDSRIRPVKESWRSLKGLFAMLWRVRTGVYSKTSAEAESE